MKFLIAASPFDGHYNPLLQIGQVLHRYGHDIIIHAASYLRDRITGLDAQFIPLHGKADFDPHDFRSLFPEHGHLAAGTDQLRFILERVMIDRMPDQYAGLRWIMRRIPVHAIIADRAFFGTMPLLLGATVRRPTIIHYGLTCLYGQRKDGSPVGLGLQPPVSEIERREHRAARAQLDELFSDPVQRYIDRSLESLDVGPLPMPLLDAIEVLPDLNLQPTVPGFEFPLAHVPSSLAFVGALPPPATDAPLPEWAADLDGARRVILVTQGTLANNDLGQLIAPTFAALADEPDLLVVATTGGLPLDTIPGSIPANARIARHLPFDWLLPKVDLLVTNGGYGTVNLALRAGVPIVVAGLAGDRAEIAARVAWSGTGVNLATNDPTNEAIREAVLTVLQNAKYRVRSREFSAEFAKYDTESEIVRHVVEACLHKADPAGLAFRQRHHV